MDRWTELALCARRGDADALAQLVDLAYGPTRRLCSTLVDEAGADDLAQETFLAAARAIRRFRGDSSARTWLFAIAHHVCASELRARVRLRRHAVAEGGSDVADLAAGADQATDVAVDDLIDRLDPERRAAFTLTQLYGLSYEETAVVCRCAPGTVGSRVARARDDLIRMIDAERIPDEEPEETGTGPTVVSILQASRS
jgi:RNA polymerase sigma-70 factor (ECF subfamily)